MTSSVRESAGKDVALQRQTAAMQARAPVAGSHDAPGGRAVYSLSYLLATPSVSQMPPDLPEPTASLMVKK